MKKITIVILLILSGVIYSQSKSEKIKEIVGLSGMNNLFADMKAQFVGQFKKTYPKVDEAFWKQTESEIDANSLINETSLLFEKYYTAKEIDELLKFYKSPVGKKMIQSMPLIMQDSQIIGRNWAMETARKINDKLEKEGYLKSPPPPSN